MKQFDVFVLALRRQATDASAAEMDCHTQTFALAVMKRMNPARMFSVMW